MNHNIISSYHHSFAGGSKNTSRFLHYLSEQGWNVNAYFFEIPQYFINTKSNVRTHTLGSNSIQTEVIDPRIIRDYSLVEKIVRDIDMNINPILFGANLFPYCNMLYDVKNQIIHSLNCNPKLVIHPVGSDIWQIGPQLKSRVKWLLDNPLVDTIFTYSDSFIAEIKDYYNIEKEIYVLPPVLEKERFFPICENVKNERRTHLGFREDDFIMHHHSSMRRIKCPEIILKMAIDSSQLVSEKCILIMTGTIPNDAISLFNLTLEKIKDNDHFVYKTNKGNLTIYWTGIIFNVEYLLQISDVELNASLHDSFNLSLMEAMACGIPVVTSDVVGISSHILRCQAGVCFPTKKLKFDELNIILKSEDSKLQLFDIDYAIDGIVSFAKNKNIAAFTGNSGAIYVLEQFSIDKAIYEFCKHIS